MKYLFRVICVLVASLYAGLACAAIEANTATLAELDGIKGIGPATSRQIVEERKKMPFKNWDDFISRVNGVHKIKATHFSEQGLTVAGSSLKTVPASSLKAQR